jgi:C-terminal processing protease CtpA/Prc
LRDEYLYPSEGEATIEVLEEHLKNGEYDDFVDSDEFSWRLNCDRNERPYDGHLFISYQEQRFEYEVKEKEKRERSEYFQKIQYGFENVSFDSEAIQGKTVATLSITHLLPLDVPGVRDTIAEKMNSVADADVLIIDMRGCVGVHSSTAAFMLSYLFDEPRRLTYFVDRFDIIRNSSSTLPFHQLPAGAKTFGGEKPVYVLTNNRTIHQAEGIAYSLQVFDRGTIVGEQLSTMGLVNHKLVQFPICEKKFGKGWWSIYAETLKLVHEVTNASWQGVGVKSDIFTGWTEGDATGRAREVAISFEKNRGRNVWEVQEEL